MCSKIKSVPQKLGKIAIMAIVAMFIAGVANAQDKKEVVILQDSLYVFPEDIGFYTYSEAIEACKTVNSDKLYGYSDWRLPTSSELLMIYHYYSKIEGRKPGPYLSNSKEINADGYRIIYLVDAFTLKGEKPAEYHFKKYASQGNIRLVRTNQN